MIRLLCAFALVFGVGAFTLLLWQKQTAQYNFSFEQKEDISKSFQDALGDFEENLAPFGKAVERLGAIDWGEAATSSLEQSTTTEQSGEVTAGQAESATSSEETAK